MTIPDADLPTPMRARRLRFERFVLDLDRGCLLLDGNEIALRPKTFGVLRHLVENAGVLVSKEELFAAVWPNLVITDDVLVQSIGELRRALGDDGARLIRTIPRRGYRFESRVSAVPAMAESAAGGPPISIPPSAPEPQPARLRVGLFASLALGVMLGLGALWFGSDDRLATRGRVPGAQPAIAVLAFVDHSDEPGREYFADGLTQDIINALGRFSALTVVSWNAVLPYKNKPSRPEEVGRRLGVAYMVEGSVRRVGERVRVSAQLVDTRQGQVLWSARFDEALADVFALQDRITAEVVGALAVRVTQIEQRRVLAKPTENLEAYDYVLRARPALQRPTRADIAEARALLRRAVELDPNYAAAHAALSETYYIATSMGWAESPTAFMERAEKSALTALSLDHSEVRARVVLGRIHIFHQRYKEAEAEIERAIAINPNDARSLAGRGNILMWLGRTDAAIEALERAQRIDPDLSPIDRFALGLAYYLKRRYGAATEQAELNLRGSAGASFSRVLLAAAYAQDGRAGDAARAAAEVRRTDPTFDPEEFGTKFLSPADLDHLREGLRKAGLREKAARPG
jgi:TolB-like protein/DNA-binding winged helix-turn-helix (wHTH) protein/cytochrome c-type biogenesis protein CcmH/NrfG